MSHITSNACQIITSAHPLIVRDHVLGEWQTVLYHVALVALDRLSAVVRSLDTQEVFLAEVGAPLKYLSSSQLIDQKNSLEINFYARVVTSKGVPVRVEILVRGLGGGRFYEERKVPLPAISQGNADKKRVPRTAKELVWIMRQLKPEDLSYKAYLKNAVHFIKTFFENPVISEEEVDGLVILVLLNNRDITRGVISQLIGKIKRGDLLNLTLVDALADAMDRAQPDHLNADDLVQLLNGMVERVAKTDCNATESLEKQLLAFSRILNAMVDANIKSIPLDNHEAMKKIIDGFTNSKSPGVKNCAIFAREALIRIPNDETKLGVFLRHSTGIVTGVYHFYMALNNMDPGHIITGLIALQDNLGDVAEFVRQIKEKLACVSEMREDVQTIKEGLVFNFTSKWYLQARYIEWLIASNCFQALEKLLFHRKFQKHSCLMYVMVAKLHQVVLKHSDLATRRGTIKLLLNIYSNEKVWSGFELKEDHFEKEGPTDVLHRDEIASWLALKAAVIEHFQCYSRISDLKEDALKALKTITTHAIPKEVGLIQRHRTKGACIVINPAPERSAKEKYQAGLDKKSSPTEENNKNAFACLLNVAQKGHLDAQCELGLCYIHGFGVEKSYEEAVKWLQRGAERGHAKSQYNLGLCYKRGLGIAQDLNEAVKWYQKSADQGDVDAQNNLGICYKNGQGVTRDIKEAMKWYQKSADQGNAKAQNNLGICYKNGQGVTRDIKEAMKWFQKAADQGNAKAQNNLGICYKKGQGVARDFREAAKWYRKAADQGDSAAQCNLGICYKKGQGVKQDITEAVKWFQKAADQGNAAARAELKSSEVHSSERSSKEEYQAGLGYKKSSPTEENKKNAFVCFLKAAQKGHMDAQCELGRCYIHGRGVEKRYEEAVKWFQKAANQGDALAQYSLGFCYENGQGVAKDFREAVKWYRKAADQGEANAQCNLGGCYEDGQGVAKDFREALKWYQKAADQGLSVAQYNLGVCYEKGQGVAQDFKEAVKWYQISADQGNALAQYNLGVCYYNGQGVAQDFKEAVKWYQKSADQGNAVAQYSLASCYKNGQGVVQDFKEAVKWYQKSADQGNAKAQYNLGICYYNDQGVAQDFKETVKWFRKAADKGHADAQYNLGVCYYNGQGVAKDFREARRWFQKAADRGQAQAKDILKSFQP